MLTLDQQICFPVYALSRQITSIYRPLLDALSLTYPQYLVFLVLWEEDKINVKTLGKKLYLDSGTLTPLLKRLEQRGLLIRKRSPKDERVVEVFLTEEGRKLKEKAQHIPEQLVSQFHISEEKLKQLKESVTQTLQAIRQP